MKRVKWFFVMILMFTLSLSGCSPESETEFKDTDVTATQAPEEVVIFQGSDGKYGLRRGNKVIADPVWSSVNPFETSDGTYYRVLFDLYNSKSHGLINSDGHLFFPPSNEWECHLNDPDLDYIIFKELNNPYATQVYHITDFTTSIFSTKKGDIKLIYDDKWMVYSLPDRSGLGVQAIDANNDPLFFDPAADEKGDYMFDDGLCMEYFPSVGFQYKLKDSDTYAVYSFSGYTAKSDKVFHQVRDENVLYIKKDSPYPNKDWADYQFYDADLNIIPNVINKGHHGPDYVKTEDGQTVMITKDYKYYNITTNTLTEIKGAVEIWPFEDGMARMANADGLYGYINDNGEIVYDFQFEDADDFEDGKAFVVSNYSKKTIDKEGNIK